MNCGLPNQNAACVYARATQQLASVVITPCLAAFSILFSDSESHYDHIIIILEKYNKFLFAFCFQQ